MSEVDVETISNNLHSAGTKDVDSLARLEAVKNGVNLDTKAAVRNSG